MKRAGIDRRNGRAVGMRLLVAAAALSACDIPTSAPILEPRFVIPGTNTAVGVEALLPPGVTFMPGAFAVRLSNSVSSWTLGELCDGCEVVNGQVVPKPAYTVTLTTDVPLPARVLSAVIRGGALTLRVANNLSIDPIRPSGGTGGELLVVVEAGGEVLARRTYTGNLPAASITDIEVPLQPGRVTGSLHVMVTIRSPAGDPVRVDTQEYVMVAAVPSTPIEMTSASIRVVNQPIETSFTSLDLRDIDETTRDQVRDGALVLRFENPFAATGDLQLTVTPAEGEAITKELEPIPPGSSVQRVPFTGEEMQRLLGSLVSISAAGAVNQSDGRGVTIEPSDSLLIRADLDLTITTDAN